MAKVRHVEQLFYYFTLVVTPLFLFSGVFSPVERLPEIAQSVIELLPMYHVVEMSRDLFYGEIEKSTLLYHAMWAVGVTAMTLPFPVRALRRATGVSCKGEVRSGGRVRSTRLVGKPAVETVAML